MTILWILIGVRYISVSELRIRENIHNFGANHWQFDGTIDLYDGIIDQTEGNIDQTVGIIGHIDGIIDQADKLMAILREF